MLTLPAMALMYGRVCSTVTFLAGFAIAGRTASAARNRSVRLFEIQPCSLALLPLEDMKALERFCVFSKGRSNDSERSGDRKLTALPLYFLKVLLLKHSINVLQHLLAEQRGSGGKR